MTPTTEAKAAIQLNAPLPHDRATAVNAGKRDCGKDTGLALLNQNEMKFRIVVKEKRANIIKNRQRLFLFKGFS